MSINNQNTYLNIEDAHLRLRTGNVYAQGITIGGITVDPSHGLQRVSDTGNVTATTLQFDNATTAFTTTANVTVGRDLTVTGNALVSSNLTVTGNAVISDDLTVTENLLVSNNLTVTGNTFYTNPAAVLVDSNVVTEYTGPHDRPLRKYPEVAMTADVVANDSANTYTQAGYTVTASSQYIGNGTIYRVWKIFDEKLGGSPAGETWIQGDLSAYDINGDYVLSPANNLGTGADDGEWVKLELPNKITLERIHITPRDSNREPEDFKIYGSIDNVNWVEILSETGASPAITTGTSYMVDVRTTSYKYLGMVIKKIVGSGYFAIDNLELYGYEEGSGSLDTTLKSVYNVPATTGTQLEVYYDGRETSSYSGSGTNVNDISPNTNNGTLGTGIGFDSTYKAFTFDGTANGKITGSTTNSSGDWTHSTSFWVKMDTVKNVHFYQIGPETTNFDTTAFYYNTSGFFQTSISGGGSAYTRANASLIQDTWYHIVVVKKANEQDVIYLNSKKLEDGSYTNGTQLSLPQNTSIILGHRPADGGVDPLDGSIANFRLYSKALNAGQIQELYDYQKDYFLGSKSQVTLYKGHLGVGVTEPSGQLELAGDERLQEYPPGPMDGYETLIPGHGVFCAYASSGYTNGSTQNRFAYNAFDKASGSGGLNDIWQSVDSLYNGGSGTNQPYTGSVRLAENLPKGHYLGLKMPYPVKITSFVMGAYFNSGYRAVGDGLIVGRNTNNPTWEVVHTLTNSFMAGVNGFNIATNAPAILITTPSIPIDNTKYYDEYALVVTGTLGSPLVTVSEWRLFGTPGPTTLDKGSLSLTRSLDVPRVSRYDVDTETPRPEKLVVDFDTTVNSSPTDISGKGNHGVFYNGASYSAADKAFTFDGTNDTIYNAGIGNWTNNISHTFSWWFKCESASASNYGGGLVNLYNTASTVNHYSSFSFNVGSSGLMSFYHFGNDVTYSYPFELNRWYHVAGVYSGSSTTGQKLYVDGVDLGPGNHSGVTTALVLGTNPKISLGGDYGRSNYYFDGQISNFKLYNVALEPSEIKKLYNLGRTGRSMVISDTAVGIGKVPEAQLDVRGVARLERLLINGTLGHILLEEAEIYYDPSRADCQDRSEFMNNTVRDIKGNYNGTKTGISEYNQFWDQDVENSGIATNNNVDLRRDWTAMVWLKPNTNDNLSGWRILGHGTTTTNGGLHFQGADTTKIRAGMYGNDIDVGTVTGMSRRREWNCMTFAYYHNNGVAGGCDKMIYQNERLVGHQQGGVGDGTHFSNNVGGSAAQNGHQPYSASPNKLRFGAGFSSGSSGKQYQHIGPCIFIPRFLSIQEVRSLYRFFEMRYSLAGSSSG